MPSGLPPLDQVTAGQLSRLPTADFTRIVRMYWPPEAPELEAWTAIWSTLRSRPPLRAKARMLLDDEIHRCQSELAAVREQAPGNEVVWLGPQTYISIMLQSRARLEAPASEPLVPPLHVREPHRETVDLPQGVESVVAWLGEMSDQHFERFLLDHLLAPPGDRAPWVRLWELLHGEPVLQRRAVALVQASFAEVTHVLDALEDLRLPFRKDPLWRGPRTLARALQETLWRLRRGPEAARQEQRSKQVSSDVMYVKEQVQLQVEAHRTARRIGGDVSAVDQQLWDRLSHVPTEAWEGLPFLVKAIQDHRVALTDPSRSRQPDSDDVALWAILHEYVVTVASGKPVQVRNLIATTGNHDVLETLTDLRKAVAFHRETKREPVQADRDLWAAATVLDDHAAQDPRARLFEGVGILQRHRVAVRALRRATPVDATLWGHLQRLVVDWHGTGHGVKLDGIRRPRAD